MYGSGRDRDGEIVGIKWIKVLVQGNFLEFAECISGKTLGKTQDGLFLGSNLVPSQCSLS